MITEKSTLKDVYNHPVGRDILKMGLRAGGRWTSLLKGKGPLAASVTLGMAKRLTQSYAPGVVDALIELLNLTPETPPATGGGITHRWWKEAVVYQIYPRSFQDSDGDGIGDLAGIRSRLPYLKELGVDVIWLSPIYDSPNDDMGYDIRDYRKISHEFGSMKDFDALLKDIHKSGMKLLMDLVVNHTSDEHAWFQKALADPEAPERDYYIWAKGRDGGPPNNWASFFSGPAWNHYGEGEDWALHLFSKKQMDLNWESEALRGEVYDMVNWWLDKGVDGFRLDVINLISKASLEDGNAFIGTNVGYQGIEHYFFGPRLHEYLKELRAAAFEPHAAFTVGELAGCGMEMSKLLTAEGRGELDLAFNFDHLDTPGHSRAYPYRYNLRYLKRYFLDWQMNYGDNCWQSLFFENHDNPRMISKVNPDPAYRPVIAKLLALLQFTLKGTPFLYQGQEIGMTNSRFASLGDIRDVETLGLYEELREKLGESAAFEQVAWGTRDHARTPMQWDAGPGAGFSTGEPWLALNPNYPAINVETEVANPDSIYHFFKALIALRKGSETLLYGQFCPVFNRWEDTFCYFRIGKGEKYYVEINLTEEDQKRPGPLTPNHQLVAGNYGGTSLRLRPYEANLYKLEQNDED